MIHFFLTIIFLLSSFSAMGSQQEIDEFIKVYKSLEIPVYDLSHEKNMMGIISLIKKPNLYSQMSRLRELNKKCKKSEVCQMFNHEVQRLDRRIGLAKKMKKSGINSFSQLKKNLPIYKESYLLALSEWTNDWSLSVSDLLKYEYEEIQRIRKLIALVKVENNEKTASVKKIKNYLQRVNKVVNKNMGQVFTLASVPKIKIEENTNQSSLHIPGYYDSSTGTFFFSVPKGGVYLGDLDWLFLHEALPGHHMQIKMDSKSLAKKLFSRDYVYLDFIEGWAAYVENYGEQLGVYQSLAAKRKALEWDLLRSTRVIIDIGLHLKGWGQDRAKKEWFKLAPETFHLSAREIKRMQAWPAQVVSYEYGKMKIVKARDRFLKKNKSLLAFHDGLLRRGQVPTSFL